MVPTARRLRLILLLAAGWCALPGCFGISQNPSYFPHLLPTGDLIPTHAKPPCSGYYANFDPHAIRLEVRPLQETNPVRTQYVLIATVYDGEGPQSKPRRNRRVEWMVEGVGNIVEVDESGIFPGRGYKQDNKYGVSYTNYCEHRITRGNGNPNDDFVVRPGQTWCVLTSPVEGDTYITVYAPGIFNWEKGRVFVNCRWVDANWEFPQPATARSGSEHVFTTRIFRHTDRQPLANYKVRYTILDGPAAVLLPSRTQEAVVVSDLSGNAQVAIAQQGPAVGVNRVSVEIIRPPDPTAPSGVGIVLAKRDTSVEWLAPAVSLRHDGPPTGSVNQDLTYVTSVTNSGKVESQFLTITSTVPDGVQLVTTQPQAAVVDGKQLAWTLAQLPAGQTQSVQVVYRAPRLGQLTSCAAVVTGEGLKDQKCTTTQITQGQLKLSMNGPATGVVNTPLTYDVTVSNPGTGPAANVTLKASFDVGLEHDSKASAVMRNVGTLAPLDSRVIQLALTPRQAGRLITRVTASADGGLTDSAEQAVTVQQPALGVSLIGPPSRHTDRRVQWNIQVTNPGDVPLQNVVLRDRLPAELTFQDATLGGRFDNGEVVWNLGALDSRAQRIVQLTTVTGNLPGKTVHTVVASADPGLRKEAQVVLDILALPAALNLDVSDNGDPAEVGKAVTYQIKVKNSGAVPTAGVELVAEVPPEEQLVKADGGAINKQTATFKVGAIPPNQEVTYTVETLALKGGDARFRARLRSQVPPFQEPLLVEECTTIVDPRAAFVPAGPRPNPAGGQPGFGVRALPPVPMPAARENTPLPPLGGAAAMPVGPAVPLVDPPSLPGLPR